MKIFHGREPLLSLPRAAGDRGVVIDYRHIITHLLRKPGAFAQYVHREELFPDSSFRLAYDRLVADHGERAGRLEYLHLLKLAAELGEAAISTLVGEYSSLAQPQKWGEALLEAAHPTVEHYLPLLYCMGSTDERDAVSYPYEGFDFGSISMRMILFGDPKPVE